MKKNILLYTLVLVFSALIWSGCKNEIEINADPQEKAVVYGIINPEEAVQYIRINRSYLVNGNALDAAKDPSLMLYSSELNVTLQRFEDDEPKEVYTFTPDSTMTKSSGLFYTAPHIVFKCATPNLKNVLSENSLFKLVVENTKTGYKAESTTKPVFKGVFGSPRDFYLFQSYNPTIYSLKLVENNGVYSSIAYNCNAGLNSRVCFPYLRMYYHEVNDNNIQSTHFVDYKLPSVRTKKATGTDEISLIINGEDFYRYLGYTLEEKPVKRFVDSIRVVFEAGNDDFDTYYSISSTSSNTTLEKPTFTNIKNGLGIFSAKYTSYTTHKNYYAYPTDLRPFYLDNATNSILAGGLSAASLKELATGKYTNKLGFAYFVTSPANPIDTLFR